MNVKRSVIGLVLISLLFGCNQKTKKKEVSNFHLKGTVNGSTEGNVILRIRTNELDVADTVKIVDGKFEFIGNYPKPMLATLILNKDSVFNNPILGPNKKFIVENLPMEFIGDADQFYNAKITGSKKQDEYEVFLAEENKIIDKYRSQFDEIEKVMYKSKDQSEIAKVRKDHIALFRELISEIRASKKMYINKHPETFYAGCVLESYTYGKSGKQIKAMLDTLSPSLKTNPKVAELRKKVAEMMTVELTIDKFIPNASNVSYAVDQTYKGEQLQGVIYLAAFKNNNLCALLQDGSVQIIDPKGKELNRFKPLIGGSASSVSVDRNDKIYVMSTLKKEKKMKVRGKTMTHMIPNGVKCHVYNIEGKEEISYDLKDLKSATGTKVVDDNLMVADFSNKKISIFDKKTGKLVTTINDMRPCCGILDFSVNDKKELLVANLGAFKVQGYDLNGKILVAFGKRGKGINDFHGCCNPVSVAALSTGAIVTVEKDPTRIKVYSKEGAKTIAGIEELVKGCLHIPMAVDANDNVYLASHDKGIVKCVSVHQKKRHKLQAQNSGN